jgi:hypothetical protein
LLEASDEEDLQLTLQKEEWLFFLPQIPIAVTLKSGTSHKLF